MLIHSFTHSFLNSLIPSLTPSLTCSLIHSFLNSLIPLLSHSFTHSFLHSLIHSFHHSLTLSFIQPCLILSIPYLLACVSGSWLLSLSFTSLDPGGIENMGAWKTLVMCFESISVLWVGLGHLCSTCRLHPFWVSEHRGFLSHYLMLSKRRVPVSFRCTHPSRGSGLRR